MVLLKNENALLPLDPAAIKTLAVIGPNAAAPCFQGGTFAKISVRPDLASPIEAIRARFGRKVDEILGTLETNLGKFLGAVQRGRGQLASASPERTEGGSAQFTEITT